MNVRRRLASAMAAGGLVIGLLGVSAGIVTATVASDQGVTPTEVQGNITLTGGGNNIAADCDEADGIETGSTGGSDTTDSGVTVTWTWDGTTKEFGFTASGGLVTIAYVKGSNSFNVYDYTGFAGGGVSSDGNMFAPDNASGPAGLSHAVFCTGPGGSEETPPPPPTDTPAPPTDTPAPPTDTPAPPTFFQSQAAETDAPTQPNTSADGNGTSGPSTSSWLLLIALGMLLGSVVVMTPARAKNR